MALVESHSSLWMETSKRQDFPKLEDEVSVDVAIVGGGLTGMTTAYLLKKSGKKVAVIEASKLGEGTTGFTTGHITPILDTRYKDLLHKFSEDDCKMVYRSLIEAKGKIASIISGQHI